VAAQVAASQEGLSSVNNNNNNKIEELVQVVTHLTCIREMLGSNLGWNAGYPDRVFVILPSPSSKMQRQ
jgi:hypothetical protein